MLFIIIHMATTLYSNPLSAQQAMRTHPPPTVAVARLGFRVWV